MRTTHSHDLPLMDPPNISPVLSSAQCGPSQPSTSSPTAPSPSPTFRHTDQDIPLNVNMPSTEANWLQDLTGMDVDPLPSSIINDTPSPSITTSSLIGIDDTHSPIVNDTLSPGIDNALSPSIDNGHSPGVNVPMSPPSPDNLESTPGAEVPP